MYNNVSMLLRHRWMHGDDHDVSKLLPPQLQSPVKRLNAHFVQEGHRADANHDDATYPETAGNNVQAVLLATIAASRGCKRKLLDVLLQTPHELAAAVAISVDQKHTVSGLRKYITKAQVVFDTNDSVPILTDGIHEAQRHTALAFELNPGIRVAVLQAPALAATAQLPRGKHVFDAHGDDVEQPNVVTSNMQNTAVFTRVGRLDSRQLLQVGMLACSGNVDDFENQKAVTSAQHNTLITTLLNIDFDAFWLKRDQRSHELGHQGYEPDGQKIRGNVRGACRDVGVFGRYARGIVPAETHGHPELAGVVAQWAQQRAVKQEGEHGLVLRGVHSRPRGKMVQ
jgi:hypothetical protein